MAQSCPNSSMAGGSLWCVPALAVAFFPVQAVSISLHSSTRCSCSSSGVCVSAGCDCHVQFSEWKGVFVYEQIRTITRLINLEARRKCLEVPGCLKLGEKVLCTLHTAVCTCVGPLCCTWAGPGHSLCYRRAWWVFTEVFAD